MHSEFDPMSSVRGAGFCIGRQPDGLLACLKMQLDLRDGLFWSVGPETLDRPNSDVNYR